MFEHFYNQAAHYTFTIVHPVSGNQISNLYIFYTKTLYLFGALGSRKMPPCA